MVFDDTGEVTRLTGIPHLVVEILSSDPAADIIRKSAKYAAAGVERYWTINPVGPEIIVHHLADGILVERGAPPARPAGNARRWARPTSRSTPPTSSPEHRRRDRAPDPSEAPSHWGSPSPCPIVAPLHVRTVATPSRQSRRFEPRPDPTVRRPRPAETHSTRPNA